MVLNEKTLDQWLATRCVVLPESLKNIKIIIFSFHAEKT